jgi:hypothetical protein
VVFTGGREKPVYQLMPRRKKKFACGHRGYGQICHKCEQKQMAIAQKKAQKQKWQETFDGDLIDLRGLPKNVVLKARRILSGLQNRRDYREFRGKRLRHDRFIISIPVTRDYRLICRDRDHGITPEAVVSHEDYNVCKPGK